MIFAVALPLSGPGTRFDIEIFGYDLASTCQTSGIGSDEFLRVEISGNISEIKGGAAGIGF